MRNQLRNEKSEKSVTLIKDLYKRSSKQYNQTAHNRKLIEEKTYK